MQIQIAVGLRDNKNSWCLSSKMNDGEKIIKSKNQRWLWSLEKSVNTLSLDVFWKEHVDPFLLTSAVRILKRSFLFPGKCIPEQFQSEY